MPLDEPGEEARCEKALQLFDEANAADPRREAADGEGHPKELIYGRRMSAWLDRIAPDAPEAVRLAVRAQHIRRWEIPRESYPMDRPGYRAWRTDLGKFHARTAAAILYEVGYDDETISHVESILRKERLKTDLDSQLLEDVACMVFLDHYFEDFIDEHDEPKLVNIVRRTWAKMSDRGHAAALQLIMSERAQKIVEKALAK